MRAVGSFPPSAVSHGRVVTQLLADWPVRKTHHFSNPRIGQSSRRSARRRLSLVLRRGGGSVLGSRGTALLARVSVALAAAHARLWPERSELGGGGSRMLLRKRLKMFVCAGVR